jgi:hypothetical protein
VTQKKFVYEVQCDICNKKYKVQYNRETDVVCSDDKGNYLFWPCEDCKKEVENSFE